MNISEWMTRAATQADMTAALDLHGRLVSDPVPVREWVMAGQRASAAVVFGPFKREVSASGVRIMIDEAATVEPFDSLLTMPAGQTFRASVTIGVD